MTALLIVLAAIVLLFTGYVFYGSWLAKQWGIDPTKKTPAIEKEDGVDYVAAKPAVLMGHHFSSIAGAGPINGPIQASIFGWVPVFLWCIIGGIFFGGLQDFGSLFASIRHDGKSVGEIIEDSMGSRAKKLFIIFALLAFGVLCGLKYAGVPVPIDIPYITAGDTFTVSPREVTLSIGGEAAIQSSAACTLSSSNHAVATISDNGTIRAVGEGTCTITAKATKGNGTARVNVIVTN